MYDYIYLIYMIRIVVKTLKFRGEDTKISKIFLGENPAFTIKDHNLYEQIYLLKMIRIVVKTLKFLKMSWGEPPSPKQPITTQCIS